MTRISAILDLAKALNEGHQVAGHGTIHVIPVVVDELDPVLEFLEPMCRALGGRLLDCRDPALNGPVPGTADPVLRAAVQAQLQDPTGRRVVVNDLGGGQLDVAFDNPPAGPTPSPGERTVLALARSVLHADWETHELIVIAYPGSVIDLTMRDPAWNLGAGQLAGMPHRSVRTVIYVAETELRVPTHSHVDSGFAFALEGPRLLRRTGRDTLTSWAAALANDPSGIVLFLGAGFSASSRLPLGNGLRDTAIKRLLGLDLLATVDSLELARRFHRLIRPKSGWLTAAESLLNETSYAEQLTLEQVIRAEANLYNDLPTLQAFKDHHDAILATPGRAVLDLADLLATGATKRLVLTGVNFDLLVETHSTAGLKVFDTDANFADAADYLDAYFAGSVTEIPYLKFHGSISDFASCVVSTAQTELGLGHAKLEAIRRLFPADPEAHRRWVYVGASMRDKDLFRTFQDADFSKRTDELWVAPWLVETVDEYMQSREQFWLTRPHRHGNDRLISTTADDFLAALRAVW